MPNEGLWEQLEKLDCAETAQRAKCEYLSDKERYIIQLLNVEYIVDLSCRKIYSCRKESPIKPAAFLEELCLLALTTCGARGFLCCIKIVAIRWRF